MRSATSSKITHSISRIRSAPLYNIDLIVAYDRITDSKLSNVSVLATEKGSIKTSKFQ
jgi:hypothetical protein